MIFRKAIFGLMWLNGAQISYQAAILGHSSNPELAIKELVDIAVAVWLHWHKTLAGHSERVLAVLSENQRSWKICHKICRKESKVQDTSNYTSHLFENHHSGFSVADYLITVNINISSLFMKSSITQNTYLCHVYTKTWTQICLLVFGFVRYFYSFSR